VALALLHDVSASARLPNVKPMRIFHATLSFAVFVPVDFLVTLAAVLSLGGHG